MLHIIQLYQIKPNIVHTYCMVLTTRKTGIADHRYGTWVAYWRRSLQALSDQGGPSTYTLHGAYYVKDRDSRP